jgi:GNAT superfamily N-acetyltransferase
MIEEAPPLLSVGDSDEKRAADAFARMLSQRGHYRAYISLSKTELEKEFPSGFIFGSVYERLYGEPRRAGHILHWYVLPDLRGSGMGLDLYDTLLFWFKKERVEVLEVMARKEPARTAAWTHRGYTGVVDLFMMKAPWA